MVDFQIREDFYLNGKPFKIWELYTSLHQPQDIVFPIISKGDFHAEIVF